MNTKPLESSIERKAVKLAKELKIRTTKLNVTNNRGIPDRIFWIPGGRPLLAEFKRPGKEPTKLQARTIKWLDDLGYCVGCWSNYEAFETELTILVMNSKLMRTRF